MTNYFNNLSAYSEGLFIRFGLTLKHAVKH